MPCLLAHPLPQRFRCPFFVTQALGTPLALTQAPATPDAALHSPPPKSSTGPGVCSALPIGIHKGQPPHPPTPQSPTPHGPRGLDSSPGRQTDGEWGGIRQQSGAERQRLRGNRKRLRGNRKRLRGNRKRLQGHQRPKEVPVRRQPTTPGGQRRLPGNRRWWDKGHMTRRVSGAGGGRQRRPGVGAERVGRCQEDATHQRALVLPRPRHRHPPTPPCAERTCRARPPCAMPGSQSHGVTCHCARLGMSVCQVTCDQKGLDLTAPDMGMQLVPTKPRVQQEQILPSGAWYGADSERNSVPLPDTSGMSALRSCAPWARATPRSVLCGVLQGGAVRGVVWFGVPKALLPEGNGRDVYPRVQVNGRGCVCCMRAVCMCVGPGGERGSREDLVGTPLATVHTPGAPAALPLAPLVGAGVVPAVPTPSCCPGPGGPSAACGLVWCGVACCAVPCHVVPHCVVARCAVLCRVAHARRAVGNPCVARARCVVGSRGVPYAVRSAGLKCVVVW